MQRDEFKDVVRQALEKVTSSAEKLLALQLPRTYALSWLGEPLAAHPKADVVEEITTAVYLSEERIFPVVDLFLDDLLADGRLLVICYRAGYAPCPYGQHWQYRTGGHNAGQLGPFKLGCANLLRKLGSARNPDAESRTYDQIFIEAVQREFRFLVEELGFTQDPPAIWLGGREAAVTYRSPSGSVAVHYDHGCVPCPWVEIRQGNDHFGLHQKMEEQAPGRVERIKQLRYRGDRATPDIVHEYADFLHKEGQGIVRQTAGRG